LTGKYPKRRLRFNNLEFYEDLLKFYKKIDAEMMKEVLEINLDLVNISYASETLELMLTDKEKADHISKLRSFGNYDENKVRAI
jgi:hypothetical protein